MQFNYGFFFLFFLASSNPSTSCLTGRQELRTGNQTCLPGGWQAGNHSLKSSVVNSFLCSFFCLSKKIEPKKRTPIVGISPAVNQAQNLASLRSWISKLLSLYSYYWINLIQNRIIFVIPEQAGIHYR